MASHFLDADIVDSLPEGVLVCDAVGRILRVNPALQQLTGYTRAELCDHGMTLAALHDAAELVQRAAWLPFALHGAAGESQLSSGGLALRLRPAQPADELDVLRHSPRWTYRRRDGSQLGVRLSWHRLGASAPATASAPEAVSTAAAQRVLVLVQPDLDGLPGGDLALDSAWRGGADASWRQLPGTDWFLERATLRLQRLHGRGTPAAVAVLEVDQAAPLRDALRDDLLALVIQLCGQHVRSTIGTDGVLALVGQGLLACVLEGDASQVDAAVADLQRRLAQPLQLMERSLRLTASVGLAASLPGAGVDSRELLHRARVALGAAQTQPAASAAGRACWFRRSMQAEAAQRLELEALLRNALEQRQFSLVFQPQLQLHSGRIVLMETLLRWNCPGRGLVSPALFVPMAEDLGLIGAIGEWVLNEACREAGRLRRLLQAHGTELPQLAVNVSARQLLQPGLVELVGQVLAQAGLEPKHLEIEVTESVLLGDEGRVLETMQGLHALGVGLAIDDFGTGYSSFSYLTRFPFQRLKIDRSLVVDVDRPGKGRATVAAIVSLAHKLGMKVTAEGVETAQQADTLRALQCDEAQGFWFSRPLAPQALERVLTSIASGQLTASSANDAAPSS